MKQESRGGLKRFARRLFVDIIALGLTPGAQLAIATAQNLNENLPGALPAPARLAITSAQRLYEILLGAAPKDRAQLSEEARAMSAEERRAFALEILGTEQPPELREAGSRAIEGMLQTLRASPKRHQLLQTINQQMLRGTGQTLQPLTLSPQQRLLGAAVASSMMAPPKLSAQSPPEPSTWPQVPGFKIRSLLGQGAFAHIYLAHRLNKQGAVIGSCALKVGALNNPKRFRSEVKAMQGVSHPNLIDYLDSGVIQHPNRFWIAMPNLSGLTLRGLMEQGLDLEQRLLLAAQILEGLKVLHGAGIIHRDLKPENVLITDDAQPLLSDFGLSRSSEGGQASTMTQLGVVMGTPNYMSLEQARGLRVGAEADVWAFGVLLYELLTGGLPFEGISVTDIAINIIRTPLNFKQESIPEPLRPILTRCLEQETQRRYQSAAELAPEFLPVAEELRRELRHERYQGGWSQVIEGRLLEAFAARCQGRLPDSPAEQFVISYPELPELDMERLDKVLSQVFKLQREVERLRAALPPAWDWEEEVKQAEKRAQDALKIRSIEEAMDRAAEVVQAQQIARAAVEKRRAEAKGQARKGKAALTKAERQVAKAVQQTLRREMEDYKELKAREARREAEARARREEAEREKIGKVILERSPERPALVYIPSGSFMMGSPDGEGRDDEHPQHRVELTRPFLMAATPVTQRQYEAVMENNPSHFKGKSDGSRRPVEYVSWFDAVRYCNALSAKERFKPVYLIKGKGDKQEVTELGGDGYRLPTEAEWEYSCRAWTGTAYFFGDDAGERSKYAWFGEGSEGSTHPVGEKEANPWGMYDMYGNVWEWCWDWYSGAYTSDPGGTSVDPKGTPEGPYRVIRGGSYWGTASWARSAFRYRRWPWSRYWGQGFRPLRFALGSDL